MSKLKPEYSENEDDPDPFESSGDEWDSSQERDKKRNSRRASQRLSKKPRVSHSTTSEEEDEEEPKKRTKNGTNKKQKVTSTTNSTVSTTNSNSKTTGIHKKFIPKTIYSSDFGTGSFVINKKDAQVGDPNKHPCIWRIDGKALLQKFEAFDDNGKVRHKNTSVYTGWSPLDKDQYAPVTVDVQQHNNHTLIVELHWDKLKEINQDSD